jgi:ABC-2 type transport system permease protein
MMRAFITLARVEFLMLMREPAAVGFTLLLPLVLLTLNGGDGNRRDPELGGAGMVDIMVPGYLVYVMITSAVMALPETLADYRGRGILRRLRVSPLRPWQIIGAHAVTHLAVMLVGLILLVTVGVLAFNLRAPAGWMATGLGAVAAAASILATGFLLGSVLPTVRTTQAVAAGIYFPAIFISGAVFPRLAQPEVAQRIGDFLPLTYAVDAIRDGWLTGTVQWTAIGNCAATAVVAAAVALWSFRWEGS